MRIEHLLLAAVSRQARDEFLAKALATVQRLDKPYRVELLARVSDYASGQKRQRLLDSRARLRKVSGLPSGERFLHRLSANSC